MLARELIAVIDSQKGPQKTANLQKVLEKIRQHQSVIGEFEIIQKEDEESKLDPQIKIAPYLHSLIEQDDAECALGLFLFDSRMAEEYPSLLETALKAGSANCLLLMLTHASFNFNPLLRGKCLLRAAELGHLHCVQILIEQGGIPVDYQTPKPERFTNVPYGITVLMKACRYGRPDIIRYLLTTAHATANLKNSKQCTPFCYTFVEELHNSIENYQACARLLLEHGADAHIPNKYNKTALHYCARYMPALLPFLLELGLDPNIRSTDLDSCTPLEIAIYIKNLAATRLLLEAGSDLSLIYNLEDLLSFVLLHKEISLLLVSEACQITLKNADCEMILKELRAKFEYTLEEIKIIHAAANLKKLSDVITEKKFNLTKIFIDLIFGLAPQLFAGFFRQSINRKKKDEKGCLFEDPCYQHAIIYVLSLAANNHEELYQEIAFIVGQDIHKNSTTFNIDEKNLFATLFLTQAFRHEKFKQSPINAIIHQLLKIANVGNLESLRENHSTELNRLEQCVTNLKGVIFSELYRKELSKNNARMPCLRVMQLMIYIRLGNDPIILPKPSDSELFLSQEGKLHTLYGNEAAYKLLKRLRLYEANSSGRLFSFWRPSKLLPEIPRIVMGLLSLNHTNPDSNNQGLIANFLAYLTHIQKDPAYQEEFAANPQDSLASAIKQVKEYLQPMYRQENQDDHINDQSL